jgi:hypothetical protein
MFGLRSGFAPLSFPYVQPRLRIDAEPVRYLDLFCSNHGPQGIPAALLLNHLYAFISISVLKDRDAREDPDFIAMKGWLADRESVGFVDKHGPDMVEIAERAVTARAHAKRSEVRNVEHD